MLLVDVHELDVVLAYPVTVRAFKHHVHNIWRIFSLQRKDVLILRAAKHLLQRREVDAERDVAITAERREGLRLEHHGNEGDVGVVHGLQGDARVIAVEVAILDQILDRIDNLSRM